MSTRKSSFRNSQKKNITRSEIDQPQCIIEIKNTKIKIKISKQFLKLEKEIENPEEDFDDEEELIKQLQVETSSDEEEKEKSPTAIIAPRASTKSEFPSGEMKSEFPIGQHQQMVFHPQSNNSFDIEPVKPKRANTAYIMFIQNYQNEQRKLVGRLNYMTATKAGASIWKSLTPDQKEVWHVEAEKDKLREQNEFQQLKQYGFFIDQNGNDSRFIQRKPKVIFAGLKKDYSKTSVEVPIVAQTHEKSYDELYQEHLINQSPINEQLNLAQKYQYHQPNQPVIRPKKPLSPYFCYINAYQAAKRKEIPNANFMLVTKEGAKIWNSLSEQEKEPWIDAHLEEKERFNREQEEFRTNGYFINKDGISSRDILQQNKRNFDIGKSYSYGNKQLPGQIRPKGVMTSYICFITNFQKEQRILNPNAKCYDLTKEGSDIWNQMNDDEKWPWKEASEQDKERLAREMKELQETGYFINKDGISSRDMAPEVKHEVDPEEPNEGTPTVSRKTRRKAPKKALGSYMFFVREKQQQYSDSGTQYQSKLIAKEWSEMTDEQKYPFFQMRDRDKVRYDKQMVEYNNTGYWTNADSK